MKYLIAMLVTLCSLFAQANNTELFQKMRHLDSALFSAFNQCEQPEQLKIYESYFVVDLEFYHDNGGVTWKRKDMIDNTQNNACGNYTRELLQDTFKAYPINGFGAITQGTHRFCQKKTTKCTGVADFVMIWQQQGDSWQITRALSYGHREIPETP